MELTDFEISIIYNGVVAAMLEMEGTEEEVVRVNRAAILLWLKLYPSAPKNHNSERMNDHVENIFITVNERYKEHQQLLVTIALEKQNLKRLAKESKEIVSRAYSR